MRGRKTLACAAALALPPQPCLHAQGPAAPVPAYSAGQLHCARYAETSRSEIETQTARGSLKAQADRDGIWSLRARDSGGVVVLEAWYDSLSLRRRTAESEVTADTDGLIGGRYRGLLGKSGSYLELATPVVPDDVAEVADLSGAARDLLPPLPPGPRPWCREAARARCRSRSMIRRASAGRLLLHYGLGARSEAREAVPRGDTVPIPVRQTTVEQGNVYWSPGSGLVRRTREITVEATIPSGGRITQPVRSRVVQRVELTRLSPQPSCS